MIPYGRHSIDDADIAAVVEVLSSSHLTQGPKVQEFEEAIADYVGARYAVAVSSGTAALHIACLAADVKKDDNVITSPITFVASANCAAYVGATPCFADIDADTICMSPHALIEECNSLDTVKAIIPVHFAGHSCDMAAIQSVAKEYGAVVIEDAAHAFGGKHNEDNRIGSCAYSDMCVFSFHPVKSITSGEGGVVTTNSESIYQQLLLYRNHGIVRDQSQLVHSSRGQIGGMAQPWYYEQQYLGMNYRLSDIHAALGLSQFAKVAAYLKRRQEIAAVYDQAFNGLPHIEIPQQNGVARSFSALHLYVVKIDYHALGMSRNQVMHRLRELNVGSQVHYIPVHTQPYYESHYGYKEGRYPNAEAYYQKCITLPLSPSLNEDEVATVISAVQTVLKHS